jgi:hypothetical protein
MATRKRRRKSLRTPKQAATELAIERRREKALQLRLAGWSIRDIAGHLKCSVSTAHTDVAAVLDRTLDATDKAAQRGRALSLARLDVATKGIWPAVESGSPEAARVLVRLEQRRAKLEGIDAPTRIEASGPDGAPIPIDARSDLLTRIAGLVAGSIAGGTTGEDSGGPDR